MKTPLLTASQLALLVLIATVPFGAACSSDATGAGAAGVAIAAGAPSAGAPAGGAASAGAAASGAPSAGAPAAGASNPSAGSGGASAGAAGGGGAVGGGGANAGSTGSGGTSGAGGGPSGGFVVSSPDQADGAKFGTMYTCAAMNGTFGAGVNPELDWAGVPANTLSFAITFIDTKLGETSAMGQHWAIWDIPANVKKLTKATTAISGELAGAKQSNKYLAPCPSGDDTYEFTVYALSTATLNVSGAESTMTAYSAGVAKVLTALKALTPLGTAKLKGTSGAKGL